MHRKLVVSVLSLLTCGLTWAQTPALDPMYEKARPSDAQLSVVVGPNRFRVAAVARPTTQSLRRMAMGDGRGKPAEIDQAILNLVQGPRHPSEDVAVVVLDTPQDRFDVRRLRVFDHDARRYLSNAQITRIPGTSAFRIGRWFEPLPERIDFWMDVASYAANTPTVLLQPKAGATVQAGGAALTVREVRAGRWGYRAQEVAGYKMALEWQNVMDSTDPVTMVVIDCDGKWKAGRYQLTGITRTGRKVMCDFFEDFKAHLTTIRELPIALDDLAMIELRPFSRPGPFYVDGVVLPARKEPIRPLVEPPTVVSADHGWSAVLPCGVKVELMAIGTDEKVPQWWLPDGQPTSSPDLPPGGSRFGSRPDHEMRVVVAKLSGVTGDWDPHLRLPDASGYGVQYNGQKQILVAKGPFVRKAETTISIGVATAPWKVLEDFPASGTGWMKQVPLLVRSVKDGETGCVVETESGELPEGVRLAFVDIDGEEQTWKGMSGRSLENGETGLPISYRYELGFPKEDLKTIRVKWRSIEYAEFKGVQLTAKKGGD